jgi:Flp pilus assembly secretin CpaC
MFPQGNVHAEGINDGVMLSGAVASPIEAQQAYDLATRLVGDATKVVNGITIRGRDQVMIHVAFAEMDRDVIKQFGINVSGQLSTPGGVPYSVALQSIVALPLASIMTLDSVTVAFDTGKGASTAGAAPPGGESAELPNIFWTSDGAS